MKLFRCQHCGQLIYFENTVCERCGHRLGYIPDRARLAALEPLDGNLWRTVAGGEGYRFCANAQYDVCNWLLEDGDPAAYCVACRHNRVVPDTSIQSNLVAWRKIEAAKHRLFYTLMALRLPLEPRPGGERLTFDFLASLPHFGAPKVMTGHDNGLITLAVEEAHDPEREARRTAMGEPYRTLLGHLRHEVGHYYWGVLVGDGGPIEAFRRMFGDDSFDYGQALQNYYANGAPADWQNRFVSAYASAHPWEDFAETWAHYLHIVDTLEMARAFGVYINPPADKRGEHEAEVDFDPYLVGDVAPLIDTWIPLSNALNSLNRALGQPDTYPFILSPPVIEKLGFVHDLIRANKETTIRTAPEPAPAHAATA